MCIHVSSCQDLGNRIRVGDLAKKKTFPALFHLHRHNLIPKNTIIYGYARTKLSREDFWKTISSSFQNFNNDEIDLFLDHCHYHSGNYNSTDDMKAFNEELEKLERETARRHHNRIFYMALPPSVFTETAQAMRITLMTDAGWNRIIVEKPFGRDLASSDELNRNLGNLYKEHQLFRIDHYLGKEMVQNLMVLRFANLMFEPIWNSHYISNVKITFKEDFGTEGRAGYFDQYGIIRDVMQNHLLQILSLIAMEPPVSMMEEDVRDEKVKVLRSVKPLELDDLVVGQYGEGKGQNGKKSVAYLEEKDVPKDSITPTFATAVLAINNQRWNGVPFILKCGKNLEEKKAEVRIQFKTVSDHLFKGVPPNELVFRIQPNEAIYFKTMTKIPGLTNEVIQSELDLSYKKRFAPGHNPDAYERLLLDVFRGDRNLFVRADELSAAWKIFTPALHRLEKEHVKPIIYPSFTRGPKEADELSEKYGWKWHGGYVWPKITL